MEPYPTLKSWPEAVLPILLVSAFTNSAGQGPDGNWFSLDDQVDDKDGAGAAYGLGALYVASQPVIPGNNAVPYAYD